jgi:hypothetical protein
MPKKKTASNPKSSPGTESPNNSQVPQIKAETPKGRPELERQVSSSDKLFMEVLGNFHGIDETDLDEKED